MKKVLVLCFLFLVQVNFAQTYSSDKIALLSHLNPNNGTVTPGWAGNHYSGCWGWHQTSSNREYAIIGASNGTYFIDVTVPTSPTVCAFVPGREGSTWREMKTYQNYCYIVSDDGAPNTFQIIDMSPLPGTVTVVHDGTTYFERAHTIWIDNNKMYVGGVTYTSSSSPMSVYSLATPTAPVLLRELSQDIVSIGYVHDMYSRNDTIYASAAFQGLYVLKFNSLSNTFSTLGSYTGYAASAYNHSSFLTKNGKYLVFCDEIPEAMPIHLVNVENLSNIQPIQTFKPAPNTTPHNPYVIGNNFAVVSCYQDGLIIYDISQPNNLALAGYFDTYPQGGNDLGVYPIGAYRGNWGAYPYLPSGIIIANDMQNGVFILDPSAAYTNTVLNPVGTQENSLTTSPSLQLSPNPASNEVKVSFNISSKAKLELKNSIGQTVYTTEIEGYVEEKIDLKNFAAGVYLLNITSDFHTQEQKLIITH